MTHTIIVVPTPKSADEYRQYKPFKTLEAIRAQELHHITIDIVADNIKGISQIYNERLKFYANQDHIDHVVFMHDDVEIHDQFFLQKIKKAHETYDVVGLAGATSQDYTPGKYTPAWHLCMSSPKDGRGFVSHVIPKDVGGYPFPYINSSYFGPSPSEVCFVDGLFISFKLEAWRAKSVTFNEAYTFHHYDMSACAELQNAGFSIGVWPIFAVHYGLGDFNNDPLWHELAKRFMREYNNYKQTI